MHPASRPGWRTLARYARVLAGEFRWTLLGLASAVGVGGLLFAAAPQAALGGRAPTAGTAVWAAWMALFGEPVFSPPGTWYLAIVTALYPLVGFGLVGEGIVRFGLLMLSRRQGEKWWMKVMASTHRDHVVLCGLGHVGFRVLEQLLASGTRVVAIEKDASGRFVEVAKASGAPVLLRDMKEDQALLDAGIEHARAVVLATNDDMANLEAALDARRMNPGIRVVMRMFDQSIAAKLGGTLGIDCAFSSSALAAPTVAAMSLAGRVLGTYVIEGASWVAAEIAVEPGSSLAGADLAALEARHGARVVARRPQGGAFESPPRVALLASGDVLVVHAPAGRLTALAAEAAAGRRP